MTEMSMSHKSSQQIPRSRCWNKEQCNLQDLVVADWRQKIYTLSNVTGLIYPFQSALPVAKDENES